MKKVTLIVLLILAQLTCATAKEKIQVLGHVIDGSTKKHIPYATVVVEGTTIATTTDPHGHFALENIPFGEHSIKVFFTGYASSSKKVNLTKDGEPVELNFVLKEDILQVDQIVVSSSRTETKRKNSSSLVSIMGADAFKAIGAPTLVDGLSYQT